MTFQDLYSFPRNRGLKSEVVDDVLAKLDVYGKRPHTGKFSKMLSERIHGDIDPRFVCKFGEIWLIGSRQSPALFTWQKNKTSARSLALASARIAPKICQDQLQTIYSECPKFHPNPFTSGGVIAERVNVVETRPKVFPILGYTYRNSDTRYSDTRY